MQIKEKNIFFRHNYYFFFYVMALTENGINENNAHIFCRDGYYFSHRYRINKNSGRVALYINNRIQYQIINNNNNNNGYFVVPFLQRTHSPFI